MRRIQSTFLLIAILFFISIAGCQTGRFGQQPYANTGQPFATAQNVYGVQPGFGQAFNGPSMQGFQRFGQDLGRRFSNGFLNRAINGVVNIAWRAVGL